MSDQSVGWTRAGEPKSVPELEQTFNSNECQLQFCHLFWRGKSKIIREPTLNYANLRKTLRYQNKPHHTVKTVAKQPNLYLWMGEGGEFFLRECNSSGNRWKWHVSPFFCQLWRKRIKGFRVFICVSNSLAQKCWDAPLLMKTDFH